MGKQNENNRMTSIARRINFDFWLKQLANFLLLDLVLVILLEISMLFWFNNGMVSNISDVRWEHIRTVLEMIRRPGMIFVGLQILVLFGELFNTGKVRKMMAPLVDMAAKAEALSKQPFAFGGEKIETMQQAISRVNPEMPGAKVKSGDKDLLPLEIAINNLLERMRESHRQQERFVSDASHELRTPISVIQGYANMLDRWGKEDEQILAEGIEAIKNESEHMKNLIEQLLFLARGDSGRNTLEFTDFDLTDMAREVWEESMMIDEKHQYEFDGDSADYVGEGCADGDGDDGAENAGGAGASAACGDGAGEPGLRGNGAGGSIMVHGDLAMIKQSLRIFVQNAAKYSPEGSIIKISARMADGRPAYIVQDEGIGMGTEDVTHVFERFYRSDGARNSAEGGTGLGLSIAKWIVDAHRGTVEVLSRPDIGTRFTVKF